MSTASEYWVGPTIGEGSFAQVVYAQHKATGKRVAIKVVEQVFLKKHPPAMQGLLTERKLLKELSQQSPHVVNLWASFLDSQCVYLVMELAMGGDLAGLIQLGLSDESNHDKWHQSIPHYAWQLSPSSLRNLQAAGTRLNNRQPTNNRPAHAPM
jgi:serine/threonine protein kinase